MSVRLTGNAARALARIERAKGRALRRIGARAEIYAKALCPEDSGELRRSIKSRVQGDRVTLYATAKHAPHVERGTRTRRAQPFLRPAIEDHMDEYKRILLQELRVGARRR